MAKGNSGRPPKGQLFPGPGRETKKSPVSYNETTPQENISERGEFKGFLGWLVKNRRLLGWLELVAAIILVAMAVNGFLAGSIFLPFAFGLIGLRFFYAYVQHTYEVDFGRTGIILNLVILSGALLCAILGITIEKGNY